MDKPKNVLVILGHPRTASFCGTLASAYCEGASNAGINVRLIRLADLRFNPNVVVASIRRQPTEPDIEKVRNDLSWAHHIVFIYPTWWSTMPGLMKSFLDRILIPGFAFEEWEHGDGWTKLLTGKSAQLITTMDTPKWVYRWLYGAPGINAMKKGTLGYCGINVVSARIFSPVKLASPQQRLDWIETVKTEGYRLKTGLFTPVQAVKYRVGAWLKAIRFQFYPMTWVAYAIGAYGAALAGKGLDREQFWIGYAFLFFLEVATVFANDYYDYRTDQANRYYGPFTGGSRVLVEGHLSFRQLSNGIRFALLLAAAFALWTLFGSAQPIAHIGVMGMMTLLALGYTVPPLKLCYRGLGEVDVGITHSIGVILCGYVFQGGRLLDPFPWLVSVPLFFSIVPAIILAGIPDYQADKQAGKATLAVRYGPRNAVRIAMAAVIASVVSAVMWSTLPSVGSLYGGAIYVIIPHAGVLVMVMAQLIRKAKIPPRIDLILFLSLLYIFWFGILPLASLI